MKYVLLMASGNILILGILSIVIPPVPVWAGGIIGIVVFLGVGSLLARIMEW